eukprot:IDg16518t1
MRPDLMGVYNGPKTGKYSSLTADPKTCKFSRYVATQLTPSQHIVESALAIALSCSPAPHHYFVAPCRTRTKAQHRRKHTKRRLAIRGVITMAKMWIVSAPNEGEMTAYDRMKTKLEEQLSFCAAYRLELPKGLRVGTLDSLIAVADAASRDDRTIEATTDRVLRQYRD